MASLEERRDLRQVEERRRRGDRDRPLAQCGADRIEVARDPCKDRDVARSAGSACQQRGDLVDDIRRLLIRVGELCEDELSRHLTSGDDRLVITGHRSKEAVRGRDDERRAAIGGTEAVVDCGREDLLPGSPDVGSCALEAVDRLGRVLDASGDRCSEARDDRELQTIRVLQLVDEDRVVQRPERSFQHWMGERLDGKGERIGEIDDSAPCLRRLAGGEHGDLAFIEERLERSIL